MTADLAAFLRARLDEDEAAAREGDAIDVEFYASYHDSMFGARDDDLVASRYWRRFDPARVLADVEAKRAIVELHHPADSSISVREDGRWVRRAICRECAGQMLPCGTLLALAEPFRGRPGWRDEWDTGHGG